MADPRGAPRHAPFPTDQIFLHFMPLFRKIWQVCMFGLPRVGAPYYGGILDPPLQWRIQDLRGGGRYCTNRLFDKNFVLVLDRALYVSIIIFLEEFVRTEKPSYSF